MNNPCHGLHPLIRASPPTPHLPPIAELTHIIPIATFGDQGIFVTPYNPAEEPRDALAGLFAPRHEYRPSAPDWQALPNLVERTRATVAQHAAEIHEVLCGLGSVDISKPAEWWLVGMDYRLALA
jgi:hypothetical protein